MKVITTSLLFLILSLSCSHSPKLKTKVYSSFPISKNLIAEPLNNNTYVIKDISFYNSNVLVAKMPDGTVIIASSPIDTRKTVNMLKWINTHLKPKKIIAINTHFHADGTGGNEGYHKYKVEIWSSNATKKLYSTRAKSMRISLAKFIKNKQLSKDVLKRKDLPANIFFDANKGLEWSFGKEKVIVNFPGPGHSPDNLVVYLPEQKILFGGCLLRALDWKGLGNKKDANINKYYSSAKSLLSFKPRIVIPGHGNIGGIELINHTMGLALKAQKQELSNVLYK